MELAIYLYPTDAIKQAVSILYAHILEFLVRASEWYEEGKIARALHSITRSTALRYDDLLIEIRRATQAIADSATTSAQAEQRDMHHGVQALTLTVKQLREDIAEQKNVHHEVHFLKHIIKQFREDMLLDQSIKASTLLDCQNSLFDIQLMQAFELISSTCSVNYRSSYQLALRVRDKHRLGSGR